MRYFLVAILVFLSFFPAASQEGPSVYSLIGVGDIQRGMGVRSAGMGYTGIGFPTGNSIPALVPAAWAKTTRTQIEGSYLFERFGSKDLSLYTARSRDQFNGAALSFPLSPERGLTLALGFVPYSNVGYDITTNDSQLGIDYKVRNTGDGGITTGFAGGSFKPVDELAIGFAFDLYFGTINEGRSFSPLNDTLGSGSVNRDITLRGPGVTIGAMLTSLGMVHESLAPFSLGFTLSSRAKLSTTSRTTFDFVQERDTTLEVDGAISLPFSFGAGIGYKPDERYQLAVDYAAQLWGGADLPGLRQTELRDSYRFSVGAERAGKRDVFASWFDKLTYRLGAYYEATNYFTNGLGIDQWGITGGLGINLGNENRIDVALEYAQRGTLQNNLVKDNILRLSVAVNIGELWFVRYDPEDE